MTEFNIKASSIDGALAQVYFKLQQSNLKHDFNYIVQLRSVRMNSSNGMLFQYVFEVFKLRN